MRSSLKTCLALLALLSCASSPIAAPEFPPLTGRVVDLGGFLNPSIEQSLAEQLAAHENATSNQVVVATLADLQGYTIEEFGYQLARHWGIGEKEQNNGVVLLIARTERKIRIEVGYGLEGTLTDAISSNIIHSVIQPAFKKAQFERGIREGVSAIIEALGGEYAMRQTAGKKNDRRNFWLLLMFVIIFWPMLSMFFLRLCPVRAEVVVLATAVALEEGIAAAEVSAAVAASVVEAAALVVAVHQEAGNEYIQ